MTGEYLAPGAGCPTRDRCIEGPSMASTLRAEVRHAELRLERARDDLRRWLLSHGEDITTQPRKAEQ